MFEHQVFEFTHKRILSQLRWTKRKAAAKRDLIDTGTDNGSCDGAAPGRFKESDDVGKWLVIDRRKRAKRKTTSG